MLSHPNLVKLLGCCWEDRELLLVYELMSRGSLENHIFRSKCYNLKLEIKYCLFIFYTEQELQCLHLSQLLIQVVTIYI